LTLVNPNAESADQGGWAASGFSNGNSAEKSGVVGGVSPAAPAVYHVPQNKHSNGRQGS
jgi:hypothetical protein